MVRSRFIEDNQKRKKKHSETFTPWPPGAVFSMVWDWSTVDLFLWCRGMKNMSEKQVFNP